jgi:hypothetical protein
MGASSLILASLIARREIGRGRAEAPDPPTAEDATSADPAETHSNGAR